MKYKSYLILLLVCFICGSIVQAQEKNSRIKILHNAIKPGEMPYPGSPVKFSVTLENTKNSQLSVRGFFVRDGKIIEQAFTDFSTNDYEQLVYSTIINAPLAELNYQFVVLDGSIPVSTSQRYNIRRSCLPKIESISGEISNNPVMKENIKTLQKQATSIQDEVQNYETALKLLDELKVLTEK